LKQTRLTEAQILDAEHALEELGNRPFTLTQAVKHFVTTYREPVTRKEVGEAFIEFLREKTKANRRPDTIRNLRGRLTVLVSRFGGNEVAEILPVHIGEILNRPGLSPVGADNDRRAFSSFFSWATKKGYCADNPLAKIERITTDRGEPDILPLETVRKLLDAAQAFKDGVLVPYVTLGLFAAIRPTELARLSWKDIDLKAGTVTLGAKLAKMRGRRIVELSENAIEWLLPHAIRRTPIKGVNWRKEFDAVKRMAGIKEWTQDLMRHTAISYHLAKHQHEGKTAQWAGNSPDIIQRHYKSLVPPSQAAQFWAIVPEFPTEKIVKANIKRKAAA